MGEVLHGTFGSPATGTHELIGGEPCECGHNDGDPWVVIVPEEIIYDEVGSSVTYHTVLGPYYDLEEAKRAGWRYSYSILSPMIQEDAFCRYDA